MAAHLTLTEAQTEAVLKFLDARLESVDELVEEMGQEDAFRIFRVMERMRDKTGDEGK